MNLVVDNLAVDRGSRRIVDALSFRVAAGEALVLTGPNGAGKTTLIRAIAGFLPAASGTIRLDGGAPDVGIAEQCHLVGHRDGIKGAMTVAENATFFARYLGAGTTGGADAALERLGIGALASVPAAWLSAGQRRRLGLTRLLLARRALWLLDEPTVSLDRSAVETLSGMVREHLSSGGIVVAATHIPLGLASSRELVMGTPSQS